VTTQEAARALQVSYNIAWNLVRFAHIPPPAKNSSGDYTWSAADLSNARKVLAAREAKKARKAVPA
jgi:hypothetical protein